MRQGSRPERNRQRSVNLVTTKRAHANECAASGETPANWSASAPAAARRKELSAIWAIFGKIQCYANWAGRYCLGRERGLRPSGQQFEPRLPFFVSASLTTGNATYGVTYS
jgi:hypothetical protein